MTCKRNADAFAADAETCELAADGVVVVVGMATAVFVCQVDFESDAVEVEQLVWMKIACMSSEHAELDIGMMVFCSHLFRYY